MKRLILVSTAAGAVIGLSIVVGTFLPSSPRATPTPSSPPARMFSDTTAKIELRYPDALKSEELTNPDQSDNVLLRLTSQRPPVLVTVRTETGLRRAASLSKMSLIDMLSSNLEKAYPARFPGFKLGSKTSLTVSGRPATEVVFTYRGPSGETAKQRMLIVARDDDSAVYVAAQARESDFDAANRDLFEPVITSLRLI